MCVLRRCPGNTAVHKGDKPLSMTNAHRGTQMRAIAMEVSTVNRNALPDTAFGLKEKRTYPMPDANRARLPFEVTRARAATIGNLPLGVRISPVFTTGNSYHSDPQALFNPRGRWRRSPWLGLCAGGRSASPRRAERFPSRANRP